MYFYEVSNANENLFHGFGNLALEVVSNVLELLLKEFVRALYCMCYLVLNKRELVVVRVIGKGQSKISGDCSSGSLVTIPSSTARYILASLRKVLPSSSFNVIISSTTFSYVFNTSESNVLF